MTDALGFLVVARATIAALADPVPTGQQQLVLRRLRPLRLARCDLASHAPTAIAAQAVKACARACQAQTRPGPQQPSWTRCMLQVAMGHAVPCGVPWSVQRGTTEYTLREYAGLGGSRR